MNMARSRWLILTIILAITISFITCSCGRRELKIKHMDDNAIYNYTLTTTIVHYASAVYLSDLMELFTWTCSRCNGVTESYVGVAKNLNAIVIAFRGTQERSIQNWIEDLYWKQLDGNYPGMSDAMVHHGFYSAYHNTTIRSGIQRAIKKTKKYYGDLDIIVTGHSMGGAMASFCGLDLVVSHIAKNVRVITFGQPRVGNAAFASNFSRLVPYMIRVTNGHDMVWLYNIGFGSLVYPVEKVCDNLGEDPTCSRSVSGNSISDHLVYYGVEMGCDTSQACRMVMDPVLGEYRRTDHKGNFVLSKNPARPLLKLKKKSNVWSTTL